MTRSPVLIDIVRSLTTKTALIPKMVSFSSCLPILIQINTKTNQSLFLTPDIVALVKTEHSQYTHHFVTEGNWTALSQEESGGITFDRYKYSCNVTYYNSQYPWNKGSDYKEEDLEVVYAIAKSNIYDIEIAASSESLLNSFLDTLSIDWNLDSETTSKLPT